MKLTLLTRCTRPERLSEVNKSVQKSYALATGRVTITWHILFDTSSVAEISSEILESLSNHKLSFWKGTHGDMGHGLLNRAIDELGDDEWFYVLDDDNEMHPDLLREILDSLRANPAAEGFIFSQHVGGKDFSKLETREAKPENVKVQHIDMAQFFLRKSLVGKKRLVPMTYVADGVFIEELYRDFPGKFIFIEKVLCNYNSLQKDPPQWWLPRIMTLDTAPEMKTNKGALREADELRVEKTTNAETNSFVAEYNPDCIVTEGESYNNYTALMSLPYDFRQRWIHVPDASAYGDQAYNCATNYILCPDHSTLVSIFTPVYNTREKLHRTYQSILGQTHDNWEWVIVNDSTDTVTLKIAEEIASQDPRVKVYDMYPRSKKIIGEVKYRACCLTRGKYLLELDHDDILLPHALKKMLEAFEKHPDAGFVYSDCAEIDERYNSLTYGDGFSFGYGSYRVENHMGIDFQVANTANINPLTIRHIVGVPNHFRAWRRDVYFKIGGHNRRLTIADDYELVVRTFLETRMVKVAVCCYLQFYYGGNSQEASRMDIQRRVRSISVFYNEAIKRRFEELGKEDWGYVPGSLPWNIPPRKGEGENYVNYIL